MGKKQMIDAQVGKRISELRKRQNHTREYLAERAGISSKFLYEIEAGKKGFSIDVLRKISEALNESCDYIVFGEKREYRNREQIADVLKSLKETHVRQGQELAKVLHEILDMLEM